MNRILSSVFLRNLLLLASLVWVSGCYTLMLVSSEKRTKAFEKEIKSLQKTRSFLKARNWAEYRLQGPGSQVLISDESKGYVEGKGFIKCLVHYGVGEVDVDEHKFHYRLQLNDGKVFFEVSDLFSYKNDPYDAILNFGPKNERLASSTWRGCFAPLFEDLVEYVQ